MMIPQNILVFSLQFVVIMMTRTAMCGNVASNLLLHKPCIRQTPDGVTVYIRCGFRKITQDLLRGFEKNVSVAHFEYNKFKSLDSDLFSAWPLLTHVFFDNNTQLRDIRLHHPNIRHISFMDCGLREVNLSDFEGLPSLRCVRLRGNSACEKAREDAADLCLNFAIDCDGNCTRQTYRCPRQPPVISIQNYIKETNVVLLMTIGVILFIIFIIWLGVRQTRPMNSAKMDVI